MERVHAIHAGIVPGGRSDSRFLFLGETNFCGAFQETSFFPRM